MKTAPYAWSIGRAVPCCIGYPTALISTLANVVRPGNDHKHRATIFKIGGDFVYCQRADLLGQGERAKSAFNLKISKRLATSGAARKDRLRIEAQSCRYRAVGGFAI
jgi:hypothetical protein